MLTLMLDKFHSFSANIYNLQVSKQIIVRQIFEIKFVKLNQVNWYSSLLTLWLLVDIPEKMP